MAADMADGQQFSGQQFPQRCFVQTYNAGAEPPPDFALVATELRKRGVEIIALTTEQISATAPAPAWLTLTRRDLVVGDFAWTRAALRALGIPMPPASDYPECLRDLLHRRVWRSTLGGVQKELLVSAGPTTNTATKAAAAAVFIKPAEDAKAFSAIIEPHDAMIDFFVAELGPDVPVWCAEVVPMHDEYRVYVVNGAIRAVCCYLSKQATQEEDVVLETGKQEEGSHAAPSLNLAVVNAAVETLATQHPELCAGCALDFATVAAADASHQPAPPPATVLIEVNDGYSLGRYPGISGPDYTDLLVNRWRSIVMTSAK